MIREAAGAVPGRARSVSGRIATGLRARFGVWNELGVSYLERVADRWGGQCSSGLTVLRMHATAMGKALLAHAPPDVLRKVAKGGLPSYTPHTLTTPRQLHQALAAARRRGMALSRWELRDGECAIAVPVFSPHGAVVGALELAVDILANALHEARLPLVVAARGLSRRLAADPEALPPGSSSAALRWRADPTSVELAWSQPEVAG